MPPSLVLHSHNYTIITLARYNGNDRNTIFTSNDNDWVFGFKHMKTNFLYHKGFQLNSDTILVEPTLESTINDTLRPTPIKLLPTQVAPLSFGFKWSKPSADVTWKSDVINMTLYWSRL
eukprot:127831_1